MKLGQCRNNHFYDMDRFKSCPHCQSESKKSNIYIPDKYRALGTVEILNHGSVSTVYKIHGKTDYALKVTEVGHDLDLHNALYEIKVMEALTKTKRTVHMIDSDICTVNNRTFVYILEAYQRTLQDYLMNKNVTVFHAIRFIIEICEALIECKENNVLHLDVHPKNIFLNEGYEVLLGDFSSSLFIDDIRRNNQMRGALAFMAPEVFRNHHCSEKSDIYALGINLFCLFNDNWLPFYQNGIDCVTAIYKRLEGASLPKVSYYNADFASSLNAVIRFACAYNPDDRFASLELFRSALFQLLAAADKSGCLCDILTEPFHATPADNSLPLLNDTFAEIIPPTLSIDGEAVAASFEGVQQQKFFSDYVACTCNISEDESVTSVRSAQPDRNHTVQSPDSKLSGKHFCRFCGSSLSSDAVYCSSCGTKVVIEPPKVELDKVHFSAIAPKTFIKGEYSLIDIIMYENAFRNIVDEIAANAEEAVKETKSGTLHVGKNTKIKLVLTSPDLNITDNKEVQEWQGEYLTFRFAVEVPVAYRKKQILFIASVFIDDVISVKLKFTAKIRSIREQKPEVLREDISSAFVSYASQDRNIVAMIIQGMKKVRPDMDIFFDVDSLRSGDDWENALWDEIDKRDILFLCWTQFARDSEWVDAEWRYALEHKGIECIEPIPIEFPDVCPPPDELKQKHFNDKMLFYKSSR